MVASGLLPGAMEIMDRLAIKAAEASVHAGYPEDAAALLIVELEGETTQVEAEFAQLLQVIEASGADEVRTAQNDADQSLHLEGTQGRVLRGRPAQPPTTSCRTGWCRAAIWARPWPASKRSAGPTTCPWPTFSTRATATCTR
ncbi:MAG: FAD-linked oxidase C-terminal domain-containing protein [Caldilineaceae bacterium]